MVAVHTRTAGRLALRRTLIQDGPGMCMPGAAACASGACERPDRMRLLVVVSIAADRCSPAFHPALLTASPACLGRGFPAVLPLFPHFSIRCVACACPVRLAPPGMRCAHACNQDVLAWILLEGIPLSLPYGDIGLPRRVRAKGVDEAPGDASA